MSENQNIINENVVEKAEKQVRVKPVPDANFDWNCDPKKDDSHKSEERMRLEAIYEKTMSQIGDHEVIEGTVNKITSFGVFVNIFPGVEALLPVSEIEGENINPFNEFKVNDSIKVLIKKFTPQEHRIALSTKDIAK